MFFSEAAPAAAVAEEAVAEAAEAKEGEWAMISCVTYL